MGKCERSKTLVLEIILQLAVEVHNGIDDGV